MLQPQRRRRTRILPVFSCDSPFFNLLKSVLENSPEVSVANILLASNALRKHFASEAIQDGSVNMFVMYAIRPEGLENVGGS